MHARGASSSGRAQELVRSWQSRYVTVLLPCFKLSRETHKSKSNAARLSSIVRKYTKRIIWGATTDARDTNSSGSAIETTDNDQVWIIRREESIAR